MWLVNNRCVPSDRTAATKPFYNQLKWLFCAAIKGMPTPTEPLVNKNVLKGVPRQCNPHRVKTLEMLWDVKYSSPPTKRTHLFLRSEALHHSATQLLHNLQLLGADVGIYLSLSARSEFLQTLHSIHPSKTLRIHSPHQLLQLLISGQRFKKQINQKMETYWITFWTTVH